MLAANPSPASEGDVENPAPPARAISFAGIDRRAGVGIVLVLASLGACAGSSAVASQRSRELVMAHDDGHATGTVAFPSKSYESVMRFELPNGEHRPLRLRLQAAALGALVITVYDSTPLETPGEPLLTITRDLEAADLSDGRDGRWVVEELGGLKPLKDVVWVGVRKESGEPTIWSSGVSSGQAFVRNNDPQNPIGLLPVRRTPMIRLELVP